MADIFDEEDPRDVLKRLRGSLGATAAARPMLRSQHVMTSVVPIAFSVKGKAGQTLAAERTLFAQSCGVELFATDTSSNPGHGTSIENFRIGADHLWPTGPEAVPVPTWMFDCWIPPDEEAIHALAKSVAGTALDTPAAREIARRLRMAEACKAGTWRTCPPGMEQAFVIRFEEDCTWQGVLWAKVFT